MPGNSGTAASSPHCSSSSVQPGVTTNCAPAASTASNCAAASTVPAPTVKAGRCERSSAMASIPKAVRRVISSVVIPPSARASASGSTSSSRSIFSSGSSGERLNKESSICVFSDRCVIGLTIFRAVVNIHGCLHKGTDWPARWLIGFNSRAQRPQLGIATDRQQSKSRGV